jgi:hypothetical protein
MGALATLVFANRGVRTCPPRAPQLPSPGTRHPAIAPDSARLLQLSNARNTRGGSRRPPAYPAFTDLTRSRSTVGKSASCNTRDRRLPLLALLHFPTLPLLPVLDRDRDSNAPDLTHRNLLLSARFAATTPCLYWRPLRTPTEPSDDPPPRIGNFQKYSLGFVSERHPEPATGLEPIASRLESWRAPVGNFCEPFISASTASSASQALVI